MSPPLPGTCMRRVGSGPPHRGRVAGRAQRLGLAPLGEVIDAAWSSLPGRLAVALGWAWLGWHLLAR